MRSCTPIDVIELHVKWEKYSPYLCRYQEVFLCSCLPPSVCCSHSKTSVTLPLSVTMYFTMCASTQKIDDEKIIPTGTEHFSPRMCDIKFLKTQFVFICWKSCAFVSIGCYVS